MDEADLIGRDDEDSSWGCICGAYFVHILGNSDANGEEWCWFKKRRPDSLAVTVFELAAHFVAELPVVGVDG